MATAGGGGAMSCCKPSPFLGRKLPSLPSVKSKSAHVVESSGQVARINALFWGSRKTSAPVEMGSSLWHFTLTGSWSGSGSEFQDTIINQVHPKSITVSVVSSISEVSSKEWNACALDATSPEKFNPFITHSFLSSLEDSGSAVKETGWTPCHIIAKDESENIVGAVPLYLKSHSYGEFVFDHSWADAYYSYGSRYYPKLQCCVPFTPVTGPRILIRDTPFKDKVFDLMVSALKDLTAKCELSSLHITFASENDWHKLSEEGFLQRIGMQYHWKNRNYKKLLA